MIVALVGQKGGSGKSTLAIHLACEAMARGRSVLLVDADPQGTARTWHDVALERPPGGGRLFVPPAVVAAGPWLLEPAAFARETVGWQDVVIDGPPRLDAAAARAALMVADLAVFPCAPSPADVWALAGSLELLEAARAVRPGLEARVVLNRLQPRTQLGAAARRAVGGVERARSTIGARTAFAAALAAGQGVGAFAPRSPAAAELAALYDELWSLGRTDVRARARRAGGGSRR
jgi:chromosome partitioning protein